VYHLYHFIEPLLQDVLAAARGLTLADHGAGKSYLGFILYDLFFKALDQGHIYGIETREELVQKSRELAERLGFDAHVLPQSDGRAVHHLASAAGQIDIVTALHACDTATDDAIRFGLATSAPFHLVLVPCCQAEVAAVLRKHKNQSLGRTPLSEIWRHPLHTREFGSQVTNVLRCLLLERTATR
jgi:hypothetical protein